MTAPRSYVLLLALSFMLCTANLFAVPQRIDSLELWLEQGGTDSAKIEILVALSFEYRKQGNYVQALKHGHEALEVAIGSGQKKEIADCYNIIGSIHYYQSDYPRALEYHLNALMERDSLSDAKGMADSYIKIGNVYYTQSDHPRALEYYLKSLKIRGILGDTRGMAASYNNIGNIYDDQGDYPKALEYYSKSLEIRISLGDKTGIAGSYHNLGIVYSNQKDYAKALEHHLKSLEIRESLGDEREIASSYDNLGELYTAVSETPSDSILSLLPSEWSGGHRTLLDSARTYHLRALNINKELGYSMGVTYSLKGLGTVYTRQGRWSDALRTYEEAATIAGRIGTRKELYKIYQDLALAWKEIANCKTGKEIGINCLTSNEVKEDAVGCYQKAYEFQEKYDALKDSVFNEEREMRMATLQVTYETEKKERQISHLNTENELKAQKIKVLYLLISGIGVILLMIVLLVRHLRTSLKNVNLKQQILEQEKQQLNKDLENFALRIVEKNELLNDLRKQVARIGGGQEGDAKMKEVLSSIKHNLYIDNDRKNLELQIDQHHRAFLNRLVARFPKLTKTDKRLCSLLVLELSSKDIAAIMSITPESVKTNRSRLRKKLGLEAGASLSNFLKSI